MNKEEILEKTRAYVRETLEGEGSGHDWWHIVRVVNLAKTLAKDEKADIYIVELAALLHDIADWKFNDGDEEAGPRVARGWLVGLDVDKVVIEHVCSIIRNLSFKGVGVASKIDTLEGMVVQDADRLDALGAIGIARTFAYGGFAKRELYNPEVKPEAHTTAEAYKKNMSPTINHFNEKLLHLKGLMNTQSAKEMAAGRHLYMEEFLDRFYKEWEGKE